MALLPARRLDLKVSNDENVEKVIGLISKTTTLHVQHPFFCTFLCRHYTTTTWKCLHSGQWTVGVMPKLLEDVSINNEYEYENDFVLEVVFSAFYVSDETEFEFIENKVMGFRMNGRQIWVEVALPQQFRKQKMTLKNVQKKNRFFEVTRRMISRGLKTR